MADMLMRNEMLGGLWELCVSVSVIILVLLAIRPVMKRLPRIGMYLLWVMVVIRIAVPYSVSSQLYELFPGEQKEQSISQYGGMENSYRLRPEMKAFTDVSENVTAQKESEVSDDAVAEITAKTPMAFETGKRDAVSVKPEWVILAVWFMGVLCCVCYLCRSLLANRKSFRDAVPLPHNKYKNVYEHPFVGSSFVGGVFFPKIYVPAQMNEEDLECILAHENTHIRRQDYRIKPFAFLMFSILWFNPLVWIAYRLMIVDMEISCDESVIRRLGKDARKRYSYLLLTMASGESRDSCVNVAFGASVVKERIHHVMKYRRPTKWTSIALVMAVALCGCGIASSGPKETAHDLPKEKASADNTDAIYVEQVIAEEQFDWSESGTELNAEYGTYTSDAKGRIVMIYELRENENRKRASFGKTVLVDGKWQKEEIHWGKKLNQMLDGKKAELERIYYDAENNLYAAFTNYSVDMSEYMRDEENVKEDDLYSVGQMLFRINEETGEITELDVPVEKMDGGKEDEVFHNQYGFFEDGNYLVEHGGTVTLYNGKTGDKIKDLTMEEGVSLSEGDVIGEDFFLALSLNRETNSLDVIVMDEMGESSYTLSTGVKFDMEAKTMDGYALGAKGSTIILATQEGIFEAEYGDEAFHNVVNVGKDNLYYLAPDSYHPSSVVFKGAQEDYFMGLWNEDEEKSVLCYYVKK